MSVVMALPDNRELNQTQRREGADESASSDATCVLASWRLCVNAFMFMMTPRLVAN
jgi:hypothetical protein